MQEPATYAQAKAEYTGHAVRKLFKRPEDKRKRSFYDGVVRLVWLSKGIITYQVQ